jgi:hypothetical protein
MSYSNPMPANKRNSCAKPAQAKQFLLPSIVGLLVLICAFLSFPAAAKDPAGKVTALEGEAWVEGTFWKSSLKVGSIIYSGDDLSTGEDSRLNMRFLDKTFFTLGPEAKMKVDAYDESEDAVLSFGASILKGAFRFASGLLSKKGPEAMSVRLTTATIGVRGTHVAGEVFERREENGVIIEASATVTLLEDEEDRDTSIVVFNEYGSVTVDEPGYGTEIPDEHSPPGAVRRVQLRSINNLLRVMRNSTRSSGQKRKLP